MNQAPITSDKEWEEDELMGLLQDACMVKCHKLQDDIKRGVNTVWYNKELLHEAGLTQAVYEAVGSLVDLYDANGGLDGFEVAINTEIERITANNKYRYYKENTNDTQENQPVPQP